MVQEILYVKKLYIIKIIDKLKNFINIYFLRKIDVKYINGEYIWEI